MNEELYAIVSGGKPPKQFGQVIFYSANRANMTITEIGRTPVLPFSTAIDIYAETPNPASQILEWTTEEERISAYQELNKNIHDKEWLEQLFDMI